MYHNIKIIDKVECYTSFNPTVIAGLKIASITATPSIQKLYDNIHNDPSLKI